jgi:hypothetical protein
VAAGDIKVEYAASSALTIMLASLGTSSTRLAGRESTAVDNTTNKYPDYLLAGKVTTGTSPTVDKTIEICVVGIMEDSTWPDVFDGTDSAETVTNAGVKAGICRTAAALTVTATSDVTYFFGPLSVRDCFGSMPKKFVVFVTHDTAVNLNSTGGNHAIHITPVYHTVAP